MRSRVRAHPPLKIHIQKLLDNRCYSAILGGYFDGSDWGKCDFVL